MSYEALVRSKNNSNAMSYDFLPRRQSKLCEWLQHRDRSSSCGSSDNGSVCSETGLSPTTPTLAQLFWRQWDPRFLDYLLSYEKSEQSSQNAYNLRRRDVNLIPSNLLPTPYNNYSVSNFTIELVHSIRLKEGHEQAECAVNQLLRYIPVEERASYRTRIEQRTQHLMRKKNQQPLCAFCRNNGEPAHIYLSHILRDPYGRTLCPVLRAYTCPKCGKSGDEAHTVTYCEKYHDMARRFQTPTSPPPKTYSCLEDQVHHIQYLIDSVAGLRMS